MTSEEIRAALAALDAETDQLDKPDEDRRQRIVALHRATENTGNSELERQLRWETELAHAYLSNAAMPGEQRERFTQLHPDLLEQAAVEYLARRKDVPSVYVRARLRDFLWVHGGQYRTAGTGAAESYLELLPLLVARVPKVQFGWLAVGDAAVRAAQLARQLNQQDQLRRAADESLKLMRRLLAEGGHRYLLDIGMALVEAAPVLSDDQVQEIVSGLDRAVREFSAAGNHHLARMALWVAEEFARARGGAEDELKRLAERTAQTWISEAETRQAGAGGQLVASKFYENAVQILNQLGGHKAEVNELRQRIRKAREAGISSELRPISARVSIDREAHDRAIEAIVDGTLGEVFSRLVERPDLTVSVDEVELGLQRQREIAPLSSLFPHSMLRSAGVELSPTNAIDQDRLRKYQHAGFLISIQNLWLAECFGRLRTKGVTAEDLVDYLRQGFDEVNLKLISVGLARAWEGDFVSGIHILVPQLEDVMRSVLRAAGIDTMRPHAAIPGVSVEMNLSMVMTRLERAEILSRDQAFLFNVVIADLFGFNFRNDVAHGLVRVAACTPELMARILQLYLIIAAVGKLVWQARG